MKYNPGSFSKNFAWHGTGMKKLHEAIRSGFSQKLVPVSRGKWRTASGINDTSLELIPINFFLFNKDGKLSVDELVLQAVNHDHSRRFDHLALFAFHLNRVGIPPRKGDPRPAMWANEFVREVLWDSGAWKVEKLTKNTLDKVMGKKLNAKKKVITKCRSNYRHFYELCKYIPSTLSLVNTRVEDWIASALFLTWDRHILAGGSQSRADLLKVIEDDEIYKLLGTPEAETIEHASELVKLYLDAGGLGRLDKGKDLSSDAEIDKFQSDVDDLDQSGSDEAVERRTREVSTQVRDSKIAAELKRQYENRCMICGKQLSVSEGCYYSEAAHIKPLGSPHNGPDTKENMLILCPNHHIQFDRGVLWFDKFMGVYKIYSLFKSDDVHGNQVDFMHSVGDQFLDWHRNWWSRG